MIFNYYMVYDFETGSRNKHKTQPTQLSAIMIDPRRLTIVPGSLFDSEIKPILDNEEATKLGLDPVEDEALTKTGKTRENLAKAPELKVVWESFVDYVKNYTKKGSNWNAPIRVGFNNRNFDDFIIDRLASQYGPYDKVWQTQNLFQPIHSIDLMQDFFRITENIKINSTHSISMDSIRDWLGMDKSGAHDGRNDVLDCAELFIRITKLHRKLHTGIDCFHCGNLNKIKFDGSLAGWKRG